MFGSPVVNIQIYSIAPEPPAGRVTLEIMDGSQVGFGQPNSLPAMVPPDVKLSQAVTIGTVGLVARAMAEGSMNKAKANALDAVVFSRLGARSETKVLETLSHH